MTREEANTRLVELQKQITAAITEAEELCIEHELEFTIHSTRLEAQAESPIRFISEKDDWCDDDENPYVNTTYLGQWISSYC